MYPGGVFPTAFFLHRSYLVLMPDPVWSDLHNRPDNSGSNQRAMIRVHDLANNMELVGKYDFPENSPYRRQYRGHSHNPEAAHLHKVINTTNYLKYHFKNIYRT